MNPDGILPAIWLGGTIGVHETMVPDQDEDECRLGQQNVGKHACKRIQDDLFTFSIEDTVGEEIGLDGFSRSKAMERSKRKMIRH